MPEDIYTNQAVVSCIPTLNTLSWQELPSYVSVFEKKAFLISRIDYFLNLVAMRELDAETDTIYFGMSTSDGFSTAGLDEAAIFDYNMVAAVLQAAGVSSHLLRMPYTKDFSTLPGKGLLVPSRPIFLWMQSSGLAAAGKVTARIYFTIKELKAEQYWELVEATRLIGS